MSNRIWTELKQGTAPKGLRWLNTHRVVINPGYRELLKAADLDTIQGVLRSKLGDVISTDRKQEKNVVKRIEVNRQGQTTHPTGPGTCQAHARTPTQTPGT